MRLVIQLFDHSTASAVRQSTRAFISKSATSGYDLGSLDTCTGLPYELEQEILARYHSLEQPLRVPEDIWGDLSCPEGFPIVGAASLGQQKAKASRNLNASAAVFTPGESFPQEKSKRQLILPTIQPVFAPLRTLDWRFGLIQLDFIEGPIEQHSKMPLSPTHQPRSLELPAIFEKRNRPHTKADEKPPERDKHETLSGRSGTVDLGYGILHLYKETGKDTSEIQRLLVASGDQHDGTSRSKSGETDEAQDGDGTMVAVLAVPSNWATSDFLQFISTAVEDIDQMRIMRYAQSPLMDFCLIDYQRCSA